MCFKEKKIAFKKKTEMSVIFAMVCKHRLNEFVPNQAREFVAGSHFQLSSIFVGKLEAEQPGAPLG